MNLISAALYVPLRVADTLNRHSRRNARIAAQVLLRRHAQREEANAALSASLQKTESNFEGSAL